MNIEDTSQPVNYAGRRRAVVVVGLVTAICLAVYAVQQYRLWRIPRVPQLWASSGVDYENTDSVAALRMHDGRVRVLATAKWGDRLDMFDGASGRFIESVGRGGEGPREFRRPNGIAIVHFDRRHRDEGDSQPSSQPAVSSHAVVVVEREGARVQLLSPDDFRSIGFVGQGVLTRPYGAALSYRQSQPLLYVTDSEVPPEKTVSVFRLAVTNHGVEGTLIRQFGDAGDGRIHKAESIVVDDRNRRVLLCDEDRSQRNVKVYDLDGTFSGRTFGDGVIDGDPEGLVIVRVPAGDFILVTDQRAKITIWHAFDRDTLEYIASLTGEPRIANTDGICIFEEAFAGFAAGALFAVNDDADVRAYDLGSISELVDRARSDR